MSKLILGMGTGRCGTRSLAELLNQQPESHVTHEQPPLFQWIPRPDQSIVARLERLERRGNDFVGDVASFYLPYVDQIVAARPDVRIVCLKRPMEEVVTSFCKWLDKVHRLPTDHWSDYPEEGWFHEANWTRIFPQYEDVSNREDGIRRYWTEYYNLTDELIRKYPENVKLFTTETLSDVSGQTDILNFCQIPAASQIHKVGIKENESATVPQNVPITKSDDPMDPGRCVILVPFGTHIEQRVEASLKQLEQRGYRVRRVPGYAAIDQGRNQMATDALIDGFEETLWIDSDVGFRPDDVERLRSHNLPICCGIYPQKGKRAIAAHVLPGTEKIVFGQDGGLMELLYAATGFLHIRRQVYTAIQEKLQLPMCNELLGKPMLPFFYPMLHVRDDYHWYLAEDYAFCQRARECGYAIMADTAIRLWHVGKYSYGWEDSGTEPKRFGSFTLNLGPN